MIAGETSLEAGTEVTVRIQNTGERPLLKTEPVEVSDDGSFEATFDLSDVDPVAALTVQVVHDSDPIGEADGRVVDADESDETDESRDRASADGTGFGVGLALAALVGAIGVAVTVARRR